MSSKVKFLLSGLMIVIFSLALTGCQQFMDLFGLNKPSTVATPTFSPPAATYTIMQSVTISTTTAGASIRYTTDGSTPTSTSGTVFSATISVAATKTIKAIAYKSGWTDSEVATASYTITGSVATPTFSPAAGKYLGTKTVTISSTTAGTSIRYTTDGSTPTSTSGTVYSTPISVATTEAINAIAYEAGWTDSAVATAAYTIGIQGIVSILAGTAVSPGSTDSPSRFKYPNGITTDGTNLYVADTGNCTIRKIVISTELVTTLAGTAGSPGSTDSPPRFYYPCGITTEGTNLYVADSANNTIRKIVISTGIVTTIAGIAGSAGSTDSPALFDYPEGITTDGTNLYVADSDNDTIREIK